MIFITINMHPIAAWRVLLSGDKSGLDLCRSVARSEIHDGDVFLNLARAEWLYKHRKNTVVALKKGLQVDNRHPGLRLMREQLGIRQRSPLPFLPRSHKLNQALGKIMRKDYSTGFDTTTTD